MRKKENISGKVMDACKVILVFGVSFLFLGWVFVKTFYWGEIDSHLDGLWNKGPILFPMGGVILFTTAIFLNIRIRERSSVDQFRLGLFVISLIICGVFMFWNLLKLNA